MNNFNTALDCFAYNIYIYIHLLNIVCDKSQTVCLLKACLHICSVLFNDTSVVKVQLNF